jgi:hypothetical protein
MIKAIIFSLSILTITSVTGQNPYEVSAKQKEQEVKKDNRSAFAKQFTFIPLLEWTSGMKFIVQKDVYNSDLDVLPYKTKNPYIKLKVKDYEFKIFTFKGFEDIKGEKSMIFECEGAQYQRELSSFLKDLDNVKFFAFTGDIDKAKAELPNKQLWTLSREWFRDNEKGEPRIQKDAEKFVPVTVTQIGLGGISNPIRIAFKPTDKDEAFMDVSLSGINQGKSSFAKHFDEAFSFTDPRLSYPNISEEVWTLIKQGMVAIGMTSEECKLSWRQPDKINETILDGLTVEQWIYVGLTDTRRYLYMYNGKLKSMQN